MGYDGYDEKKPSQLQVDELLALISYLAAPLAAEQLEFHTYDKFRNKWVCSAEPLGPRPRKKNA